MMSSKADVLSMVVSSQKLHPPVIHKCEQYGAANRKKEDKNVELETSGRVQIQQAVFTVTGSVCTACLTHPKQRQRVRASVCVCV